jgi:hypothetical protein
VIFFNSPRSPAQSKLRHRLFVVPATIARSGRRVVLHVSDRHRWAAMVAAAVTAMRGLPAPAG